MIYFLLCVVDLMRNTFVLPTSHNNTEHVKGLIKHTHKYNPVQCFVWFHCVKVHNCGCAASFIYTRHHRLVNVMVIVMLILCTV